MNNETESKSLEHLSTSSSSSSLRPLDEVESKTDTIATTHVTTNNNSQYIMQAIFVTALIVGLIVCYPLGFGISLALDKNVYPDARNWTTGCPYGMDTCPMKKDCGRDKNCIRIARAMCYQDDLSMCFGLGVLFAMPMFGCSVLLVIIISSLVYGIVAGIYLITKRLIKKKSTDREYKMKTFAPELKSQV